MRSGTRWSTEKRHKQRRRPVRLTAALAALGLLAWAAIGSSIAQAASVVVYDAIGPSLPGNVTSIGFEATSTNELGDLVVLASGPRELTTVSVVMSSQACQTGGGTTCVTTPGATFNHPLTMTLYNVSGTPGAPTAGSVIATVTHTFSIPFRPSADLGNCTGQLAGRWFNGTNCFSGLAVVVDFVFPAGTILPDALIWGISYNTDNHGYDPIGTPGPYDSLNVGALTVTPTIGTDPDEDMAFISGSGTDDEFVSDTGYTGFRPMARIVAQDSPTAPTTAPPAPVAPTTPTTAASTTTTTSTTTTSTTTTASTATTTPDGSGGGDSGGATTTVPGELPATGGPTAGPVILFGIVLLLGGGVLLRLRRTPDAT